jgi:hypothetical protein
MRSYRTDPDRPQQREQRKPAKASRIIKADHHRARVRREDARLAEGHPRIRVGPVERHLGRWPGADFYSRWRFAVLGASRPV